MATDKMSDGGLMVPWGTNGKIFTDEVLTEAPEPLCAICEDDNSPPIGPQSQPVFATEVTCAPQLHTLCLKFVPIE